MDVRRGAIVRFHHVDAVEQPKPKRPGIVDTAKWGLLSVFYGSTFKRGGAPKDAEVADPLASAETNERKLAERLGRAIGDRTYFHGSMLSEADASASTTEIFRGLVCPADVLDALEEQAEDRLIAFEQAWRRTQTWISPKVRAGILYALWWSVDVGQRDRLALSLLVCDGWTLAEISMLRKQDAPAGLLPHTARLIELWEAEPSATLGYTDISRELEPVWIRLMQSLDRSLQKICPKWDRVARSYSA